MICVFDFRHRKYQKHRHHLCESDAEESDSEDSDNDSSDDFDIINDENNDDYVKSESDENTDNGEDPTQIWF